MTLRQIIVFLTISCSSCNDNPQLIKADQVPDTTKSGAIKKYEPDLSDVKTDRGNIIKYKRSGHYSQIQWFQNGQLKTLTKYEFDVYGADSWIPRFKSEGEDYLLLKAGCGSPCWLGLFLPLKDNETPKLINEYLAYDLKQNYVAYINYDLNDSLEVLNLKSNQTQRFKIGSCKSAFKGYCFDTMYFDTKSLKYSWDPEVDWSHRAKHINTLKLEI